MILLNQSIHDDKDQPLSKTSGDPIYHHGRLAFIFLALLLTLPGCGVSKEPRKSDKILVSKDAPVYDKRFEKLSLKDIDLSNLWVEGGGPRRRKQVVIHNYTFSEISDHAKNGVVNLYTRRLEERDYKVGFVLPFNIPIVSDILKVIPFQVPVPYQTEGFSLGSGFIINEQGYILTNAHVIRNATDIMVVLSQGRKQYPAKIIGFDLLTDTALIKMEADPPLTILPLGDSDSLKTGEMVIAVGNPLGLRHSVTSGIISAKERVSPALNDQLLDLVQTDSAINPGNSGGPLLNLYGEVVGVNTAVISQAQSIGFATPINTVKEVMPMLVLGKTERGWFGATAVPLTFEKSLDLDYPHGEGVLVIKVEEGSPAQKAGLMPDDIITELNGRPVPDFVIFRRKLLGLFPGQTLRLTIFRGGKTMEVSSTLIGKGSHKNPRDELKNKDDQL